MVQVVVHWCSGNGGNGSGVTAGAHGGGNFLNSTDYCSLGAAGRI